MTPLLASARPNAAASVHAPGASVLRAGDGHGVCGVCGVRRVTATTNDRTNAQLHTRGLRGPTVAGGFDSELRNSVLHVCCGVSGWWRCTYNYRYYRIV